MSLKRSKCCVFHRMQHFITFVTVTKLTWRLEDVEDSMGWEEDSSTTLRVDPVWPIIPVDDVTPDEDDDCDELANVTWTTPTLRRTLGEMESAQNEKSVNPGTSSRNACLTSSDLGSVWYPEPALLNCCTERWTDLTSKFWGGGCQIPATGLLSNPGTTSLSVCWTCCDLAVLLRRRPSGTWLPARSELAASVSPAAAKKWFLEELLNRSFLSNVLANTERISKTHLAKISRNWLL